MSKFLSELEVELVDANGGASCGGTWRLTEPLLYQSHIAWQTFTVPVGFVTDFNSTPRLPIIFLLAGDTAVEPATLHDFLYTNHSVTRAMADAVLREASIATGVPAWRAWALWIGVRLGGASHWMPAKAQSSH